MSTITASVQYTEGRLRNRRSQKLFYCSFFPQHSRTQSVKGVVLFLHGLGEHSHRFLHVYEHLVSLGFGVLAYDLVGHGRSDCDCADVRAHGEKFTHFVEDTNDVVTAAKFAVLAKMLPEDVPMPPLYFMGISYGCLVGMHTILSRVHPFSGIVLASPALNVEMTMVLRVQSLISKPLEAAFPHARIVPAVNMDALSRDAAFVRDYMSDSLNVTDKMTARMGVQTMVAMQSLAANTEVEDRRGWFARLPLLVLQGLADKVTCVPAVRSFMARVGTFDKELKEYDGLFHCIFNEPEKAQVLSDAGSWLVAHADQHATLAKEIKPKNLVSKL